MTPTDAQLKKTLAKMLPDTLIWDDGTSQYNSDRLQEEGWGLCWDSGNPVLDTELLHLCWLVEQTLGELWPVYYAQFVEFEGITINAPWQARTIALAKVKGVEIL